MCHVFPLETGDLMTNKQVRLLSANLQSGWADWWKNPGYLQSFGGKIQIFKWVWKFQHVSELPRGLIKEALLDLIPIVSDSVDLFLGPRICIPNNA